MKAELSGIEEILKELEARGAKRAALQFPEGLKRKACDFADVLRSKGYSVIISGDPCWGACDLDTQILSDADVLIHYGHAPVDSRDRVIYEFLPEDADFSGIEDALRLFREDGSFRGLKIGLCATIQHVHELTRLRDYLKTFDVEGIIAPGSSRTPYPGQVLGCSFEAAKNTKCQDILFLGSGMFHPLGIALLTDARVIAYDPFMKTASAADPSRLLRQRFAKIEKARSAEHIGIIVSKKSGQKRQRLARRLASLSDKAYLVSIMEITPDSLLNLGFDAYVNTSCPRLAYDDQARYPVPMLSPYEFEILCGVREWDDYKIDEIADEPDEEPEN